MATAQQQATDRVPEGRQEGSRWINVAPTGEQVASWFSDNVKIAEELEGLNYVQGVTLIPNKMTVKEARLNEAGSVVIIDVDQLVFTPYAKVDTRIAYFWDLMAARGHVGVIEPAPVPREAESGYKSNHLPPGFFRFPIQNPSDKKWVDYIGCSMQVRVYDPGEGYRPGSDLGRLVMCPPAGSKIVSTANKYGDDGNSLMKAETGAVGRALGMAGMFVLPGSGVATAEDMQEALGLSSDLPPTAPGVGGTAAQLPGESAPADEPEAPAALGERASTLIGQLQADHPTAHEELQAWARGRKLRLDRISETQLRGVVRKAEKLLADAQAAGPGPPADEDEPAVPADEPPAPGEQGRIA